MLQGDGAQPILCIVRLLGNFEACFRIRLNWVIQLTTNSFMLLDGLKLQLGAGYGISVGHYGKKGKREH